MRTTLTLDDDVAAKLKAESRRAGRPFKEIVNETLRSGLATDASPPSREPSDHGPRSRRPSGGAFPGQCRRAHRTARLTGAGRYHDLRGGRRDLLRPPGFDPGGRRRHTRTPSGAGTSCAAPMRDGQPSCPLVNGRGSCRDRPRTRRHALLGGPRLSRDFRD